MLNKEELYTKLEEAISTINDDNYAEHIGVIEEAIKSSVNDPELLEVLKNQFSDDDMSKKLDDYVATRKPEILSMIKGIIKRSAGLENCSEDENSEESLESHVEEPAESDDSTNNDNMGNIDSNEGTPSVEPAVNKLEDMTPDKASEALADIEESHGEDVAMSLQDSVISGEGAEDVTTKHELSEEDAEDINKIVDSHSAEEGPANFSISKRRVVKKYLANFAKHGMVSSGAKLESFSKSKAKPSRGSVISRIINMSTEDRAETLAEVESHMGEETAKEVADAAKEERLPEITDEQAEEIDKIAEVNECSTSNFSSRSPENKKMVAKWMNFSDTEAPSEDSVADKLSELTPEEGSEALAEIANRTSDEAADKIQADVLAPKSEEYAQFAEELPALTDEELKTADEVIDETKQGQVNCSKSESAKARLRYKRYMANFSEVLLTNSEDETEGEPAPESTPEETPSEPTNESEEAPAEPSSDDATEHPEESDVDAKLEEMSDQTPEDFVATTSDIETRLGKEGADHIEDAVIAKAEGGEPVELTEEEKEEVVKADPSAVNFSKANKAQAVRLRNFSVKVHRAHQRKMRNFADISEQEVQRQDGDIIERLSDSTPEEVAIVSTVVEEKCGPEAACELEDAVIRNCCGTPVTEDDVQLTTDELDVAKSVDPAAANFSGESKGRYRTRLRNFSDKVEEARKEVHPEETEAPAEEPETKPSELDDPDAHTETTETSEETEPAKPAHKKVPGVPMPEEDSPEDSEHSEEEIDRSINEQNFSKTSSTPNESYRKNLFKSIGFTNR